MINPDEVVEGREYINAVLCKSCNMIPSRLVTTECEKCKSVICKKCFNHGLTEVKDANFDRE